MAVTLHDDWNVAQRPHSPSHDTFTAVSPDPSTSVRRHSQNRLAELTPLWRSLAAAESVQPFVSPDWIMAYLHLFEPGAQIEFWAGHNENGLTAALPLVREHAQMAGVPVRRLRAPGRPSMPERFDVLSTDPRAAEAIWSEMRNSRSWDVIELVDLPEDGPGWKMVQLAREQGFPVGHRVSRQTPYLSIPAGTTSIDQILGATTAKFRANLRRRMRNLRAIGDVQLRRTTTFDETAMLRFLELEHSSWKGLNGTSILSDAQTTAYYMELARSAAEMNQLTIYALECDGEPIAMHFGVSVRGHYSVPKLACSDQHLAFAPGHLLMHEVLGDLVARGFSEFDFLGDDMPWKMEWTTQLRTHHRAHIFNKTVAGRAASVVRYKLAPLARTLRRGSAPDMGKHNHLSAPGAGK